MDFVKDLGMGMYNMFTAGKREKEREAALARNQKLVDQLFMNNQPAQPTIEASPGRDYLTSMVLGTNPDAIFRSSPNSAADKQRLAAVQSQMFGSPAQQAQRSQAFASQPQDFGGRIGAAPPGKGFSANTGATEAAQYPGMAGTGMSMDEMVDMMQKGVALVPGKDGHALAVRKGVPATNSRSADYREVSPEGWAQFNAARQRGASPDELNQILWGNVSGNGQLTMPGGYR